MKPNIKAKFYWDKGLDLIPCESVEFCLDARGTDPSGGTFIITDDELSKLGDLNKIKPSEWAELREMPCTLELTDQNGVTDCIQSLFINSIDPENTGVTSDRKLAAKSVKTYIVTFSDQRKWLDYGVINVRANIMLAPDVYDESSKIADSTGTRLFTWLDLFKIVNDALSYGKIKSVMSSGEMKNLLEKKPYPKDILWEGVSCETALQYLLDAKNLQLVLFPNGDYRLYSHTLLKPTVPAKTEGMNIIPSLDFSIFRPSEIDVRFPQYEKTTFKYPGSGKLDRKMFPMLADDEGKLDDEVFVLYKMNLSVEDAYAGALLDKPFDNVAGAGDVKKKRIKSLQTHFRRTFRINDLKDREILDHRLEFSKSGEYVPLYIKASHFLKKQDISGAAYENSSGVVPAEIKVIDKEQGYIHIDYPYPIGGLMEAVSLNTLENRSFSTSDVFCEIELWHRLKKEEAGRTVYDDYILTRPAEPDEYGFGKTAMRVPELLIDKDASAEEITDKDTGKKTPPDIAKTLAAEIADAAEADVFDKDIQSRLQTYETNYIGSTTRTGVSTETGELMRAANWHWSFDISTGYKSKICFGADRPQNLFAALVKGADRGKQSFSDFLSSGYKGHSPRKMNSTYKVSPMTDVSERISLLSNRTRGLMPLIDESGSEQDKNFCTLKGFGSAGQKQVEKVGPILDVEWDSSDGGYRIGGQELAVVTAITGTAPNWRATCKLCNRNGTPITDTPEITVYPTEGNYDGLNSFVKPMIDEIVYIFRSADSNHHHCAAMPSPAIPVKIISNSGSGGPMYAGIFMAGGDGTYTVKLCDSDWANIYGDDITGVKWVWGRMSYYDRRTAYENMKLVWGANRFASPYGQTSHLKTVRNWIDGVVGCLDCAPMGGWFSTCNCIADLPRVFPAYNQPEYYPAKPTDKAWIVRTMDGAWVMYVDKGASSE